MSKFQNIKIEILDFLDYDNKQAALDFINQLKSLGVVLGIAN